MSRIRSILTKLFPLLGFIALAATIGFQFWYEGTGREMFFSEQVVKLREDVKRGDIVTNDMWYYDKVEKESTVSGVVKDPALIIGKAAKQYIPFNAQLIEDYFDNPELITGKNRQIVKIPNDWIYSIPNTLRGKDRIVLKEVTSDVIDADQLNVQKSGPASDPNVITVPAATGGEKEMEEAEALPTYDESENIGAIANRGFMLETTVAYVKDSSNREVVTLSEKDRYDGSSVIRDIELALSIEELQTLENIRKKGSKFIVLYSEGDGQK